jgi:hypothetical protein
MTLHEYMDQNCSYMERRMKYLQQLYDDVNKMFEEYRKRVCHYDAIHGMLNDYIHKTDVTFVRI